MRSKIDVGPYFREELKDNLGSLTSFLVLLPAFAAALTFFIAIISIIPEYFLANEGTGESEFIVLSISTVAFLLLWAIIAHSCIVAYKRMRIVREEKRIGRKNLRSWENLIFAHDDLISRWGNIAMKPETLIEFSLLSDLSDHRVINIYKAFEEADRLRPNIESDDYGGMAEHSRGTPYAKTVRDLDDAVTLVHH